MTPRERLIAPVGFVVAGILFLIAAVIPATKGRPLNVAFLPIGIVFMILGAALWRKVSTDTRGRR